MKLSGLSEALAHALLSIRRLVLGVGCHWRLVRQCLRVTANAIRNRFYTASLSALAGKPPVAPSLTVACSLLLALMVQTAHPCGLCFVAPELSLLEKIEAAECVVVASPADDLPATWDVHRVLKGNNVSQGDRVTPEAHRPPSRRDSPQILVWDEAVTDWTMEGPATPDVLQFLTGALERRGAASTTHGELADSLQYFLPFLEHADARIADSAHNELAGAPYGVLRELAPYVESKHLLAWANEQGSAVNRRSALYVMWLGHFTDVRTRDMLQMWIDQRRWIEHPQHLRALLTAYIQQQGEPAVRVVETNYVLDRERTLGEIVAAIAALRIHGNAQTKVSRQRVMVSFRRLLDDRPPLAELVIDDLARWEDWSVAPQLMAIHASGEQPWNSAKIVKFLERCPSPEARKFVQVQLTAER